MAELMAKHTSSLQTLVKGQIVSGKVTKVTSQEILLDINAKTEAVVMEKDRRLLKQLLSQLHQGDTVEATVIYPESESGYPVVSLRKFVEEKLWQALEALQKKGEKVSVTVTEATKGGFLVESDNGVSGFLPNSHVTSRTEDVVGQKLQVSIVELSKENKKVVFSQKGVLTDKDFQTITTTYKPGTKIKGNVSGITSFGIFVTLLVGQDQTIDGLIHISEVSWEKVENLSEQFTVGQEVEAVVLGLDRDGKRIDLSIKRLTSDPFAVVVKQFEIDKKITGVVKEITEQGLVLDLGNVGEVTVEGMIKKDKIPAGTSYEVGQKISAIVTQVDSKRRKILLTPVLLEKPLMYR